MNVRGISDREKRRAIFDYYRFYSDFLICQETHSTSENEKIWRNEWGGEAIFSHGTSGARGVAIFYARKFRDKIVNIETDVEGRYIIYDVVEDMSVVTIVAIYAPNKDNPSFIKNFQKDLRNRQENIIIIGDYNLTLDVDLDRNLTYHNNNKALREIENLMDEFNLRDVWRARNEDKREYSWHKAGNINKASRIDFALVSAGLDQKVEIIQYITGIKTDHRALYMVVETNMYERGKGYWKLNTSLLNRLDYVKYMNLEIDKTLKLTNHMKAEEKWEKLKMRIKKATISFSRNLVSEEKVVISHLTEIVNQYEAQLPLNLEDSELLQKTKMELEEKLFERVKGVMFRSKVKWYEEGEKNTKYFFALEKAKYNAKTCYKLINENQQEIVEPQEILENQRKFYEELYAEDKDVEFSMNNIYGVHVPKDIQECQNKQIEMEELESAIKRMKNEKTPGEDGIPIDFYKVFWLKLKGAFYDMLLSVYESGQLHETARKGILNLIPKANKDTRYIKNLRPITLLNTDYKIIEKAIADKMMPALEHIIGKDQRGFMKERRISVNIRKMLDIMHYAKKEDLEAVILSLDFVKCFDKCSFSILHGSLDFFGFGSFVRKWTEILYRSYTVRVQNNGYFSDSINIEKGVHQGGCCSAIYFLVIAEILALLLRNNTDIEGIVVRNIRHILDQFADDMDVSTKCTKESVKALYDELERFRHQSGFTVSYDKTTLYRIGSLRYSNASMYDMEQFKWSNEDITVLGVTISHEDDMVIKNYGTLVNKTKNILNTWGNRNLSLMGKVQVVKCSDSIPVCL